MRSVWSCRGWNVAAQLIGVGRRSFACGLVVLSSSVASTRAWRWPGRGLLAAGGLVQAIRTCHHRRRRARHRAPAHEYLARQLWPGLKPDWRILVAGRAPDYAYEIGALGTDVPLEELKRRATISEIAQGLPEGADFSAGVRLGELVNSKNTAL
jgi:hypothetical protein